MDSQPKSAPTRAGGRWQNEVNTQLHGRWLILAWLVWLAVVIPLAVTFLAGISGYRELEYRSNLIYAASLLHIGITVDFYASYYLGVVIADALICWSVAALVLWRKSNDWMGLLTALMLVLLGMRLQHLQDIHPLARQPRHYPVLQRQKASRPPLCSTGPDALTQSSPDPRSTRPLLPVESAARGSCSYGCAHLAATIPAAFLAPCPPAGVSFTPAFVPLLCVLPP